MMQLNSHQFHEVYKKLKINLDDLGCVMLELVPVEQKLPEEVLYYSPDKDKFWIKGWVANKTPHMTLLYGLLDSGKNYEPHIERVLRDWKFDEVEIEDVGFFESNHPKEQYYCIVAHIKKTPELIEGHQRLEFLPHINTFAGYKPHFTIAYIKKNEKVRDTTISMLRKELKGKKIKVGKVNLGEEK